MPWYGSVLLAVIPAIATGLFAWLIARSQYRAAIERLEKELAYEKAKDQRQRAREVKGEPLAAFRRELARMTQKYVAVIESVQTQHTRFGISDEEASEILRSVSADWNSYVRSGDYAITMFELDDQDIIDKAQRLWQQLVQAYVKASDVHLVFNELQQIKSATTELQKLINQRLQEL